MGIRKVISVLTAVSLFTALFVFTTPAFAGTNIGKLPRPPRILDYSQFVSQIVPADMLPGSKYQASITFKNVGRTVWAPGSYK